MWVHQGHQHGKVLQEHILDLVDSAGDALAAGESYWAAVTLGAGTVTVTKGLRGIAPQKPTVGATEPFLRFELRRGDEIHLETAQHAGGGTPPWARAQLFGWAG